MTPRTSYEMPPDPNADHLRRCEGFSKRLDNYSRGLPLDHVPPDDPEPTGRVIPWIILCAMIGAGVFVIWAATWWTP